MAGEGKLNVWINQASDWLNEQEWFKEAKTKWEEIDAQSRRNIKLGAIAGGLGLLGIFVMSAILGVRSVRNELADKTDILHMVRNATEEMRGLKRSGRPNSAGGGEPASVSWPAYFRSKAATAGLEPAAVDVSSEKKGNPGTSTIEALFDVSLKKISIKQLVRFVFYVENGDQPVKLKNMSIQTDGDEGYLNAKLDVSAFSIRKEDK